MQIREATELDSPEIRGVHHAAFPTAERKLVADLAVGLLAAENRFPTISLVAEADGETVGHIAFSPLMMNEQESSFGYILAPLAIVPEQQKRGIGTKLVKNGLRLLTEKGANICFVYGDPAYYGRFGFKAETAEGFVPPYKLQYPFGWLALVLRDYTPEKEPVRLGCVDALCKPELW